MIVTSSSMGTISGCAGPGNAFPRSAAQDSLEQQLQLEVALAVARAAAAEAGSCQDAAHAEATELRERVQASLGTGIQSVLNLAHHVAGSWSSADDTRRLRLYETMLLGKPSGCCHDPLGCPVASMESQARRRLWIESRGRCERLHFLLAGRRPTQFDRRRNVSACIA